MNRATERSVRLAALALGGGLALYWSLPFDALQRLGVPRFSGGIPLVFVAGMMMVFGAVIALAPNLDLLLKPVSWLLTQGGRLRHVTSVALLYPAFHRFRTGIGLALFSLVCFTMIVMACIAASTTKNYDNVPQQASGYDIAGQPLFQPVGGVDALSQDLRARASATFDAMDAISSATPVPLGVIQPGAPNAGWRVYPASQIDGAFLDGTGLPLAVVLRLRLVMDGNARSSGIRRDPNAGGRLRAAGVRVRRLLGHHGGDGVLEDELLLVVGFENQGVLVETLDTAG